MLMDSLTQSIKKMKQMDMVENAALDAEKKAKNDADYRTVVEDFFNTVNKLRQAVETIDYTITCDTAQSLEECMDKLDEAVATGIVDADILTAARQQISRKVNPNLAREWKTFHQKKTKSSLSKLDTLGNLAGTPDMITSIRENIVGGSEWAGLSFCDDGAHTRLSLLKTAIDKIDELEMDLNLSDEIKAFIVKVTNRRARITDISPAIIEWIQKESLDEKFVINFKS